MEKEYFKTRWGIILASLGMAVGTGNVWRFPRIAAQNGGGALDGVDYSNDGIPDTLDPDMYLAPWWDDLRIENQGTADVVSYKTEGTNPNRLCTVEWYSVTKRDGDADDYHNFQVKLFESTNTIEFHYGNWVADATDSATVGIENSDGSEGLDATGLGASNTAKP